MSNAHFTFFRRVVESRTRSNRFVSNFIKLDLQIFFSCTQTNFSSRNKYLIYWNGILLKVPIFSTVSSRNNFLLTQIKKDGSFQNAYSIIQSFTGLLYAFDNNEKDFKGTLKI